MDVNLIKRSFTQTGVNNTGEVDVEALHTKLKDLLGGDSVEDVRKELEQEEEHTGMSDVESDDDDEEEEEEEEEEEGEDLPNLD